MSVIILGGAASGIILAEAIAACAAAGAPLVLHGMLNDEAAPGSDFGGVPVLGGFEDWRTQDPQTRFIAAFPYPGDAVRRYERLMSLAIPPSRFVAVVHPRAAVSPRAAIEAGAFVAANATIEHDASVGQHAIVRGGAYVSHDVRVGTFAFIGPNATLLGRSHIDDCAHVGGNAVVRNGLRVGRGAVVGIGSTVTRNVADEATFAGNPARERKRRTAS